MMDEGVLVSVDSRGAEDVWQGEVSKVRHVGLQDDVQHINVVATSKTIDSCALNL